MKNILTIILALLLCSWIHAAEAPLTLDECIQAALKNNITIISAKAQAKDAQLGKALAFSDFLPSVSSWVGYNHSEVGPASQTFIDPATGLQRSIQPRIVSTNFSSGLSVNQTIYDGGYTIANYQKSKYDEESAKFELEDKNQQVINWVEEAYYAFLKLREIQELKGEAVTRSEEALKKAESMEKVGASPYSDVLKQKVQYEQDLMNLIDAEIQFENARANLNYVLGFDVNRRTEVVEIPFERGAAIGFDEARQTALKNHPMLKRHKSLLKSAQKSIRAAKSWYLPQISGNYRYSWSNISLYKIDKALDQDYNWYAGINLGISIFEGFSRPLNVTRSKVAYRESQDMLEQTKREIALAVKSAYLSLERANKQIELAEAQIRSAEEDLKYSTARYELGSVTVLELIDAQVGLNSAKEQKVRAQYDYMIARSNLKKAMGIRKP